MNWTDKFKDWFKSGKPELSPEPKSLTVPEAIDKRKIIDWMSERKNIVVGDATSATQCPIAKYIHEVTDVRWVSVGPYTIVYEDSATRELMNIINPYWLSSLIINIDKEGGRGNPIKGGRVVAILKQIIGRGY